MSNYTVFFSWQMDIDVCFNKNFIEEALNQIVKELKKEGISLQIDYGFRGVGGNPPLLNEMLQKIDNSDIVIADLSFTSSRKSPDYKRLFGFRKKGYYSIPNSSSTKQSPNPNVLLETGNAWALKTHYRTILVMNTAFGTPEELPVDFKGLRHPIKYEYSAANLQERNEQISTLKADLKKAIKSAIKSKAEYLREKVSPVLLYSDWKSKKEFKYPYRCTNNLTSKIKFLRQALSVPGSIVRLIGPPSSGKTRLAYEIFRQNGAELPESEYLNNLFYYDFLASEYPAIESGIQFLKRSNQAKILVLDNCPKVIHKRLRSELDSSKLTCITISEEYEIPDSNSVIIDSEMAKEIGELLLTEVYQDKISPDALDTMISYSKGNIKAAISFIDQEIDTAQTISFNDDMYWEKILGKELWGMKAFQIISLLSIFEYIGNSGQYQDQAINLIEHFIEVPKKDSKYILKELLKKGILKLQGDFLTVDLISLELAKSWWNRNFAMEMQALFTFIGDNKLERSFTTRFKKIASSEGASEFMNQICSKQGSFREYNFINSKLGSSLFLSSTESHPQITCDALSALVENLSDEELFKFSAGRRNIVWALESLCYNPETFDKASRILFKLAKNENEVISNNSTNQFYSLFPVILPTTLVDLQKRLELIKGIDLAEENKTFLLQVCDRGLKCVDFMRMGVHGEQFEKTKQYTPTVEEINNYWREITTIVLNIYFKANEYSSHARKIIVSQLPKHCHNGNPIILFEAIEAIIKNENEISADVYQSLISSKRRGINSNQNVVSDKVEELVKKYLSKDLKGLLNSKIINPPHEHIKVDGEYISKSEQEAILFTEQLIQEGNYDWLNYLDLLLKDNQQLTFKFGELIGKANQSGEQIKIILAKIIETLKIIPSEQQNIALLTGILLGSNSEELIRDFIDKIAHEASIQRYAIRLSRFLVIREEDIEKLFLIIEELPGAENDLIYLKIDSLTDLQIESFINRVFKISTIGPWIAINLLYGLINNEASYLSKLKNTIERVLMQSKILITDYNGFLSFLQYEELAKKILDSQPSEQFLEFLSNEILDATMELFMQNEFHLKRILFALLDKFWDNAMPIITDRIEKGQYEYYNLTSLLEDYSGWNASKLLPWLQGNIDIALLFIRILKYETSDGEWNPLIIKIIEHYHEDTRIFDELSATLNTFSSSGSVIPYYEHKIDLLKKLLPMPFPNIKRFADKEISYLQKRVEVEKTREENFRLGEW